jgi:hypothetical protein
MPADADQPAFIEIFTVITSQYDSAGNQTFFVDEVPNSREEELFSIPESINLYRGSDSRRSVRYPFYLNTQPSDVP